MIMSMFFRFVNLLFMYNCKRHVDYTMAHSPRNRCRHSVYTYKKSSNTTWPQFQIGCSRVSHKILFPLVVEWNERHIQDTLVLWCPRGGWVLMWSLLLPYDFFNPTCSIVDYWLKGIDTAHFHEVTIPNHAMIRK